MLGQGSFRITYLAEHTALGKKVAIKEFFMKDINSRSDDGSIIGITYGSISYTYGQKFKREALNLAKLEHPNIVRVTDCFDENSTYYYVMDFVEGENLNDYLKSHTISEEEAVSIVKDVASALTYMHDQHHMLHLDLKPGNIMRRASDGHIFLIDFGLSKLYSSDGQPETSTSIGLGTPGYAPIEQATQTQKGEFRPTIDVYALGATLFKLLTGETPPEPSELIGTPGILVQKLTARGVSQLVTMVVKKAMEQTPQKRFYSIRAFSNALSTPSQQDVPVEGTKVVPEMPLGASFTPPVMPTTKNVPVEKTRVIGQLQQQAAHSAAPQAQQQPQPQQISYETQQAAIAAAMLTATQPQQISYETQQAHNSQQPVYVTEPPKKKTKTWLFVVLGIAIGFILLIVIAGASGSSSDNSINQTNTNQQSLSDPSANANIMTREEFYDYIYQFNAKGWTIANGDSRCPWGLNTNANVLYIQVTDMSNQIADAPWPDEAVDFWINSTLPYLDRRFVESLRQAQFSIRIEFYNNNGHLPHAAIVLISGQY